MEGRTVPTLVKDEKLIKKRRNQMIKSAVSLFKQKGFHRTTTREIAQTAGFSIGTLYEYIRQKEDILYLVVDSIYEQFCSRMEEAVSQGGNSGERLHNGIRAYFKLIDDMQDEMLVMYQESKSLNKDSLQYVLKKELLLTSIFEQLITDCVDENICHLSKEEIHAFAHNILVLGQMWAFRRWALHSLYTIEEYTELQMKLMNVREKIPI